MTTRSVRNGGITVLAVLVLAALALWVFPMSTARADTAPPARPTGLRVTSQTDIAVVLAWDDPGDDSIDTYVVWRRERDGLFYGDGQGPSEFSKLFDTGSRGTTFVDDTVVSRTRYVYRITARNAAGESPRSSYVNAEATNFPWPKPPPHLWTSTAAA